MQASLVRLALEVLLDSLWSIIRQILLAQAAVGFAVPCHDGLVLFRRDRHPSEWSTSSSRVV